MDKNLVSKKKFSGTVPYLLYVKISAFWSWLCLLYTGASGGSFLAKKSWGTKIFDHQFISAAT